MKLRSLKPFFYFLVLAGLLSCESWVGGEINADPNSPVDVPISAQIPSIQIYMADVTGGDFSRRASMLVQQVNGAARQCSAHNNYTGLVPTVFDTPWSNVYENILNELKIANEKAIENGYHHYEAITDIMMAYTLMMATDVWDDMPWSEALQGIEIINPKFDSQSSIYQDIYNRLDNALALLHGLPGGFAPGNDDLFYGGDVDSWIKAAHALKARGKIKEDKYSEASDEAKLAFSTGDDNFAFQYPDENSAAQWYRFNRDRTGDIEFHWRMQEILLSLNDTTRLELLNQPFLTDHPYLVADFNQEMVTYREMQFIIAEADWRNSPGGSAEGHAAYLEGIRAAFEHFGLSGDYIDYIAQDIVDPGVGNLTLEHIMTQKYIALFLHPEAYNDWRRTEIPALTPTTGCCVPVRWHYPSDEYLFNSNAPAEAEIDIFKDRVGWNR